MGTNDRDNAKLREIDKQIRDLNKIRKTVLDRIVRREENAYDRVLSVASLINALSIADPAAKVYCFGYPGLDHVDSYRSRPADLAINNLAGDWSYSAGELVARLNELLGTDIESYKGYINTVTPETKVWVAGYAQPGKGIVDVVGTKLGIRLVVKDIS